MKKKDELLILRAEEDAEYQVSKRKQENTLKACMEFPLIDEMLPASQDQLYVYGVVSANCIVMQAIATEFIS